MCTRRYKNSRPDVAKGWSCRDVAIGKREKIWAFVRPWRRSCAGRKNPRVQCVSFLLPLSVSELRERAARLGNNIWYQSWFIFGGVPLPEACWRWRRSPVAAR
ncbi:hypothetical protein VPH35_036684 [Triticum aestivum]